jgi:hypothetical protein
MRYRALDANGDYTFGRGSANFLVDTPAAVGQAVKTRLGLMAGEWFLDVTEGTPYGTEILGAHTQATYDAAVRARVLDTPGVLSITSYSSSNVNRSLRIQMTIETIYGRLALIGIGSDGSVVFITDVFANPLIASDGSFLTA